MMKNALRGLTTGLVLAAATSASAGSLDVPLYPQQQDQWCWAASGQMIMSYLGATKVTQCDEANKRLGRTDCCTSPTPTACNKAGWPEPEKYGFNYNTYNGALSYSSLSNEINNNRPVAFSWGWTGGGGHMMVARGFLTTSTGTQYVDVNNPWPPNVGDQYYTTYSNYVSGSDHVHWTDYYNFRNNPPCYSDFNNYPASNFQACFDYYAWRDRWPVTLTAYSPSGTTVMAGSFQAVPSRPVRTLMTGAQFQSYFNTYASQGWRPEQISVLSTSSGPLFTVIWTPVEGAFETYFGMSESDFTTKWSEKWNAGWVNVDLVAYNDNGVKYAATWVQKTNPGYATYINMTSSDYNAKFSSFASSGYRPVRFSEYSTPNGIRYAAIWMPTSAGFYHYYGMSDASYQTTYNSVAAQGGYHLTQISGFGGDLSAIWSR